MRNLVARLMQFSDDLFELCGIRRASAGSESVELVRSRGHAFPGSAKRSAQTRKHLIVFGGHILKMIALSEAQFRAQLARSVLFEEVLQLVERSRDPMRDKHANHEGDHEENEL